MAKLCRKCHKEIGNAEFCPHCGEYRLGNRVLQRKNEALTRCNQASIANNNQRAKRDKEPIFTLEEAFIMGVHPQDEFYRKTMELDILGKDYR